ELLDVGGDDRQHHDRDRLRGVHDQGEQRDRGRRQADAKHALDGARDQEGGDAERERVRVLEQGGHGISESGSLRFGSAGRRHAPVGAIRAAGAFYGSGQGFARSWSAGMAARISATIAQSPVPTATARASSPPTLRLTMSVRGSTSSRETASRR